MSIIGDLSHVKSFSLYNSVHRSAATRKNVAKKRCFGTMIEPESAIMQQKMIF